MLIISSFVFEEALGWQDVLVQDGCAHRERGPELLKTGLLDDDTDRPQQSQVMQHQSTVAFGQ